MSANRRSGNASPPQASSLRAISEKGAHMARRTVVTLGDLVSAACEVTGSADAAAVLLSPLSPLSRLLGRRIVIA